MLLVSSTTTAPRAGATSSEGYVPVKPVCQIVLSGQRPALGLEPPRGSRAHVFTLSGLAISVMRPTDSAEITFSSSGCQQTWAKSAARRVGRTNLRGQPHRPGRGHCRRAPRPRPAGVRRWSPSTPWPRTASARPQVAGTSSGKAEWTADLLSEGSIEALPEASRTQPRSM